jgi:hypothetical protein
MSWSNWRLCELYRSPNGRRWSFEYEYRLLGAAGRVVATLLGYRRRATGWNIDYPYVDTYQTGPDPEQS